MVIVAHNTSVNASSRQPPRLLGVFAHPDDETLCAGGTFAKYASAGAEVRDLAYQGRSRPDQGRERGDRTTLRAVREKELDAAGNELGLTETRCLDYPDGGSPKSAVRSWSGSRRSCSARSIPMW
jgi:LmbE family N-acetylglucosaminyl deacetylase